MVKMENVNKGINESVKNSVKCNKQKLNENEMMYYINITYSNQYVIMMY